MTELIGFSLTGLSCCYGLHHTRRGAHQNALKSKRCGVVKVDESCFGGGHPRGVHGARKPGRAALKQPAFGIMKRGGRVLFFTSRTQKEALLRISRGQVALDAAMISDRFRAYHGLANVGCDAHSRLTNHYNRPMRIAEGEVLINGVEAFRSFVKRRLARFNAV